MPYIVVKYSGMPRKVNFFIKVITSTLLLKLNFLFQTLIRQVIFQILIRQIMLISSNTFFSSICFHVSMQHGYAYMYLCKLFTETCSCLLHSRRNHNTFGSVKGYIEKKKSCTLSNLFSCLDFEFHFIRYNSRLLN